MQRTRLTIIIAPMVLLGVILYLIHEPVLLAVGDFLVIRDKIRPADVIHVIAGSDYRTDYGIQLYRHGYAKQIFFTGGWCIFHHYLHGQHARQRSLDRGIPAEAIALNDSKVMSTYSEVVELKEFINQSKVPIHSVIVVSDPYHMRRARWTYRRVLGDQTILEMAPVPFQSSPYRRRWWTSKESRKMVEDEYLKIVYYYARYQFSRGILKDWLASLDKD
jgi:uncharacterized SAM-binding protein YcdF (DUF218 family)